MIASNSSAGACSPPPAQAFRPGFAREQVQRIQNSARGSPEGLPHHDSCRPLANSGGAIAMTIDEPRAVLDELKKMAAEQGWVQVSDYVNQMEASDRQTLVVYAPEVLPDR